MDLVLNLGFFPALHFHGIFGYGLTVLQLCVQSSFPFMLIFFPTHISLLRWTSAWVALGGPKMLPFPVHCLDFRGCHFLASKEGNHSYLHEKNHWDDRASPQNTACVIAEDIPSHSNEVLSASHYVLLGGPSVALQICKGLLSFIAPNKSRPLSDVLELLNGF